MSRKITINLNSEENKLLTFIAAELMRQTSLNRAEALKFLAMKKAVEYLEQWKEAQRRAARAEQSKKESEANDEGAGTPKDDSKEALESGGSNPGDEVVDQESVHD